MTMTRRRVSTGKRRVPIWLAGLAAAALAVGLLAAALSAPGLATPRRGAGRLLGATPARTPVSFSVVLRLHQVRLHRFLAGLYDPRSPIYHRFIDARTFGRR